MTVQMKTDDLELWVEVDLEKIRSNVQKLKSRLSPGTKLLAVVKANGYGHGDGQVARAAVQAGADWLGVARVSEGASLREAGISRPILLLAEPTEAAIGKAVSLGLTPTVYTASTARAVDRAAKNTGSRSVDVHIKVDTGMHRYGVAVDRLATFLHGLDATPGVNMTGIWSHFAVADKTADPFNAHQVAEFRRALSMVPEDRSPLLKHMANSSAALSDPDAHFDMVRVGIAMYGIDPRSNATDSLGLEPAMTLRSRVGQVKRVALDETLSYGRTYALKKDANVVTIPCGYADGLSRSLTNSGCVLINGKRYTISGTVTMDHILVDVGDDPVAQGDDVVIIGRQLQERITVDEIAKRLDTIAYEIVCGISARVPRIYLDR